MDNTQISAELQASTGTFRAHAIHSTNAYAPVDDLVQEALIEEWRSLAEGTTTSLAAWRARKTVVRAAVRQLWTGQETNAGTGKDLLRMQTVLTHIDALDYEYMGNHDTIDPLLDRHDLMEAVSELPDRQREVVYRKFWLDETFPEIAEAMDISRKQAESAWYKAAAPRLRERLAHLAA